MNKTLISLLARSIDAFEHYKDITPEVQSSMLKELRTTMDHYSELLLQPPVLTQTVACIFISPVAVFNQIDHDRVFGASPLLREAIERGGKFIHIESNLPYNEQDHPWQEVFATMAPDSRVVIVFDSALQSASRIAMSVLRQSDGRGLHRHTVELNPSAQPISPAQRVYGALYYALAPVAPPPPDFNNPAASSDELQDEVLARLRDMHGKLDQVLNLSVQSAMMPTKSVGFRSPQQSGWVASGRSFVPQQDRFNEERFGDTFLQAQFFSQSPYGMRPDPRPNPAQPAPRRKTEVSLTLATSISFYPMDTIEEQSARKFLEQGGESTINKEVMYGDGKRIQRSFILYEAVPNELRMVGKYSDPTHPVVAPAPEATAIVLYDKLKADGDKAYCDSIQELLEKLQTGATDYKAVYALQLSEVYEHLQATHRNF